MWLGVYPRTGEHIIALESGEAIRVRTVHQLPEPDRWSVDAVLAVRALLRWPHLNDVDNKLAPRMNTSWTRWRGTRNGSVVCRVGRSRSEGPLRPCARLRELSTQAMGG